VVRVQTLLFNENMKASTYLVGVVALFFIGCGPQTIRESYREAKSEGHARAIAHGMNTYEQVGITIENLTDDILILEVDAGLFFQNPNAKHQSLITLYDKTNLRIEPKGTAEFNLPSACTNAGLQVPDDSEQWPQATAPLGLNLALLFYGEHRRAIDAHLAKKNPARLGTSEQRQHFQQVMIWAYMGNEYSEILRMLTEHVYFKETAQAKAWLDQVYAEAQQVAELIRNRDTDALLQLVSIDRERIEEGVDEARTRVNRLRDRLQNR